MNLEVIHGRGMKCKIGMKTNVLRRIEFFSSNKLATTIGYPFSYGKKMSPIENLFFDSSFRW
jgi:hypothetical protein